MAKSILSNKDTLVKKASYLRIIAADFAESMKSGNFASLYKGQGIEFTGVRDYIRGDDIRAIDWNVTARMGRPYVKQFNEERELQLFLIMDTSESMKMKVDQTSKYKKSSEAAAIVTIASELNSCPIGAVFFDGKIHFSLKPKLSKEQTMTILTKLDRKQEDKESGSALGQAIGGASKLLKTRSLVFIFSDFKTSDWEKPLIGLSHKHDVIAVNMRDSQEEEISKIGTVTFEDIETGLKMPLPSSSVKLQKEWKKYNDSKLNYWSDFCKKHGVIPLVFNTKDDPLVVLNSVFKKSKTK